MKTYLIALLLSLLERVPCAVVAEEDLNKVETLVVLLLVVETLVVVAVVVVDVAVVVVVVVVAVVVVVDVVAVVAFVAVSLFVDVVGDDSDDGNGLS